MLRALFGFDHCTKNVVDSWIATSGYNLARWAGEPTGGKGFLVNDAGAVGTPPGSVGTRTLLYFPLFQYAAPNIKRFVVGFKATIDVAGVSGTLGYFDTGTGFASSVVISLPQWSVIFPTQAVGMSAYIEVVVDVTANTFSTYKDGVLVSGPTSGGSSYGTGVIHFLITLAAASSTGQVSVRNIYFLDDIAGDGFVSRMGERVLVPITIDAATGSDWSTASGNSLLSTLKAPLAASAETAKSPYSNAPLQVSLNCNPPAGSSIDTVQLFLGGRTENDNRGPSKVAASLSYNSKTSSGNSPSLPVTTTYGQNLGFFPKAPDGTLWTGDKLDNTTLSITPDT